MNKIEWVNELLMGTEQKIHEFCIDIGVDFKITIANLRRIEKNGITRNNTNKDNNRKNN